MTGLIERVLDYQPCLSVDHAVIDPRTLQEAASALERLRGYAKHGWGCPGDIYKPSCVCGLADLLRELTDES